MTKNYSAEATLVHQHIQRLRNFILRGEIPQHVWTGFEKEPTFPQIRFMLVLNVIGPTTLKHLAQELDTSTPAASEMVDRLLELGMVTREQDPKDRRRLVIGLTDHARSCIERHEAVSRAKIEWLMEQLPRDQVKAWVGLAESIMRVLEEEEFSAEALGIGRQNGGKRK